MKVTGNFPEPTEFRTTLDGKLEIVFAENVTKIEREAYEHVSEIVYEYDLYRLIVPNRPGLKTVVCENRSQWLDIAVRGERDAMAKTIREKRNNLLKETDKLFAIDYLNLEIPNSDKPEDWIPFLRSLGSALNSKWAVYRQALRDVPQQIGFPYDVVFPKKPD